VLPFEGVPTFRLEAESLEDEQRLRVWLRGRAQVGPTVDLALLNLLDAFEGTEADA
jgi:hypothetical protein